MSKIIKTIKQQIVDASKSEFGFIKDKFEITDLLDNNSLMNNCQTIKLRKLPFVDYPGVYTFIRNSELCKVGTSM